MFLSLFTRKLYSKICIFSALVFLFVVYRQHGLNNKISENVIAKSRPELTVKTKSTNFVRLRNDSMNSSGKKSSNYVNETTMHLSIVVCGHQKLEQSFIAFKSIFMFKNSITPINLHIFADNDVKSALNKTLNQWKNLITWRQVFVNLYNIQFPARNQGEWRNLFKLCAAQRLFIPNILTNVDSLIYLDTDILFLQPIEFLWSHFAQFNASHVCALTEETEDPSTNWYKRFAKHPYVQPLGVNSGVMLMNLTRMRRFGWNYRLQSILDHYRNLITWGDQDIINIIFSQHPDKLYICGCDWNYRPDHCIYTSTCKSAEKNGISVIHGSRGYFTDNKNMSITPFRRIYDAVKKFSLGDDICRNLFEPLKLYATNETKNDGGNCGRLWPLVLKLLRLECS